MWPFDLGPPNLQNYKLNKPLFFTSYPICDFCYSKRKWTKTSFEGSLWCLIGILRVTKEKGALTCMCRNWMHAHLNHTIPHTGRFYAWNWGPERLSNMTRYFSSKWQSRDKSKGLTLKFTLFLPYHSTTINGTSSTKRITVFLCSWKTLPSFIFLLLNFFASLRTKDKWKNGSRKKEKETKDGF